MLELTLLWKWALGFLGIYTVMVGVFAWIVVSQYQSQLALRDSLIGDLRREVNRAHSKMMTVDYEKLAQLDIQARAMAAEAYSTMLYTNEMGDDIQEPVEQKVRNIHG